LAGLLHTRLVEDDLPGIKCLDSLHAAFELPNATLNLLGTSELMWLESAAGLGAF
jgi:hypothetical protein